MKNEGFLLKAWDGFKGRPQFLFLLAIVLVLSIVTPSFATINQSARFTTGRQHPGCNPLLP